MICVMTGRYSVILETHTPRGYHLRDAIGFNKYKDALIAYQELSLSFTVLNVQNLHLFIAKR